MSFRLASHADLPAVRAALAASDRVALDTEFHAERRYLPQLYLVQIKLPTGETWLLDPLDEHALEAIAGSLAHPDWVLHGGQQDLRVLTPICGRPRRVWDTQIAAALVGHRFPVSFAEISAAWLGVDLDKGETLSDWSRRPLHPEQIAYAAADVADLLTLWDQLADRAHALGHGAALEAACVEAADSALDPPPAEWRRNPAWQSLEPRSAAALEGLLAWRDRTAALLDQPARQVIPDALLAELARRLPRTRAVLQANRRLSKSLVRDFADDVLAAVHAALALPDDALPRIIRPGSGEAARLAALIGVSEVLSAQRSWAAALVLPRHRLEQLALAPPADRAGVRAALGDWRDDLAGADLAGFMAGSAALHWDNGAPTLR
jgi:ribonuclease D